eukprot:CAMPEP_0168352294 /NCGR_PEP_ID=MMETSP0213-20121227/22460_1 /TAXON_ID=151035 /ORGANISM="Euplotes harpa, Strain FSP1.4" /LENGTH=46 /DNA_ID= /DNA_START= /DNA_END= /DNA_ORIENTATION=
MPGSTSWTSSARCRSASLRSKLIIAEFTEVIDTLSLTTCKPSSRKA